MPFGGLLAWNRSDVSRQEPVGIRRNRAESSGTILAPFRKNDVAMGRTGLSKAEGANGR